MSKIKFKNKKNNNQNIENIVMKKIKSGEIKMKPKLYFIFGSLLTFVALVGSIITSIFFTNILFFLLKTHGLGGQFRLQQMIETFPWWIVLITLFGFILGIWLLKKYDFSYKKNFFLIIISFIGAIIIAAWTINYLGINEIWARKGPMRRFYQRLNQKKDYQNYPYFKKRKLYFYKNL